MSAPFRIRHAEPADAAGLYALFSDVSAYAGTLQPPYPSRSAWTRRLTDMPGHVVHLVAEDAGVVIGGAGFDVIQHPRRRHVANLGMAVSHDRRRAGVGTSTMQRRSRCTRAMASSRKGGRVAMRCVTARTST